MGGHIACRTRRSTRSLIGAQVVEALQHIVAREVDPREAAIVGVTGFQAGISVGVIPPTAELTGGTNVFAPAVQDLLERRIGEIAEAYAGPTARPASTSTRGATAP